MKMWVVLLAAMLLPACYAHVKEASFGTIGAPKVYNKSVVDKFGHHELRMQSMTLEELKAIEIRTDIREGKTNEKE